MTDDASMQLTNQAKGGVARALALPAERRKDIARRAALARWDDDGLPVASHEGEFDLGGTSISCAVLPNGKRLITQATFLRSLGRSRSPKAGTGVLSTADGLPFFLQADILRPFITDDLKAATTPIFFRNKSGGRGVGYDATLLPAVAEVYLRYRDSAIQTPGAVPPRYRRMVQAADILVRGLASVGIIALVDEATGYQRDRARDALARILEEFIAKELRPWVRTFPEQFYEHLFRLRGLQYPQDSVQRPQYFGHITNDIVYRRLAPNVLDELNRIIPRSPDGRRKHHLHRRLSEEVGHPKLREHLASVITLMHISETYEQFIKLLDRVHPRYGDTLELPWPEAGIHGL
jgi:hypothetical protein